MFYVYILYSQTLDRFYVGQTNSLKDRLNAHTKHLGLTRYTKRANDWILKYYEEYSSRSAATKREKRIKKMKSRRFIIELTEQSRLHPYKSVS